MTCRARVSALAMLAMVGCSGSRASVTTSSAGFESNENIEAIYASGLEEAFEIYADEITTAALFDYASTAEAEAVVRTLSARHFDQLLSRSLAKRGLTTRGLATFAEEHAPFFHAQQRKHWGKLQDLEATLNGIPLRVRPATGRDEALVAFD